MAPHHAMTREEHALWRGWLWGDVPRGHRNKVAIDWEACVNDSDENGHHVAHVDSLAVIALRNVHGRRWHNFLPAKAHVSAKDDDRSQIKHHPAK